MLALASGSRDHVAGVYGRARLRCRSSA